VTKEERITKAAPLLHQALLRAIRYIPDRQAEYPEELAADKALIRAVLRQVDFDVVEETASE